jgi:capsular polysaccharide transport system permease protein
MTITRKSLVKKAAGLGVLFHVCVTAPTLLATLYFGLFASNVYISESRFIVRSPSKPEASGMGVLLKTVGFSSGSGDEVFAANDYLASRDAMRELNRNEAVERAYGPGHASWIDRFDPWAMIILLRASIAILARRSPSSSKARPRSPR